MTRDALTAHFVRVIEEAPLRREPFDHLRLAGFFPAEIYEKMMREMPATAHYGELQHDDARLPDGRSARRKLELRPAHLRRLPRAQRDFWTPLSAALAAPEVEAAYRRHFSDALASRFPPPSSMPRLHPAALLLRDLGGYKISIHCDSFRKAITTQHYLPAGSSQLHLGTSFHRQENGEFQKVSTLEFAPNTSYAFPVTAGSWHSVERMTAADGERNSLMVIYYLDQGPLGEVLNSVKRGLQDLRTLGFG